VTYAAPPHHLHALGSAHMLACRQPVGIVAFTDAGAATCDGAGAVPSAATLRPVAFFSSVLTPDATVPPGFIYLAPGRIGASAFHKNAAAGLYTCTQQRQESMLYGPSTVEKRGGTQYASESALLHFTRL